MTEDEMPGWQHRLNGHGFGWTPGVGDGQGDLTCCSSWGYKESDTTGRLNWTELNAGMCIQSLPLTHHSASPCHVGCYRETQLWLPCSMTLFEKVWGPT